MSIVACYLYATMLLRCFVFCSFKIQDTVIEKLAFYTDELHAGMMVSGGHVGEIPDELVLKHQELMAKEVMPHFRDKPMHSNPAPIEITPV